jgi:hypothetical protein
MQQYGSDKNIWDAGLRNRSAAHEYRRGREETRLPMRVIRRHIANVLQKNNLPDAGKNSGNDNG